MVYVPTCTIKIYKMLVNVSFPWILWDIYVYINTWKSKQPLYVKIWNHPTETSIYKWLFRVPGIREHIYIYILSVAVFQVVL